jgi:hypothetical protein
VTKDGIASQSHLLGAPTNLLEWLPATTEKAAISEWRVANSRGEQQFALKIHQSLITSRQSLPFHQSSIAVAKGAQDMLRWVRGALGLLLVLLLGCGGGGGGGVGGVPSDTTSPSIKDVQVTPSQFRFAGGEVTISAQVSDPSGIAEVWAEVQKPDNTTMEVPLSLVGGDRYEGKFKVESNTRDDGQPLTYRVWLRARDRNGNETPQPGVPAEGLTVEVTAPLNPPQKPPL